MGGSMKTNFVSDGIIHNSASAGWIKLRLDKATEEELLGQPKLFLQFCILLLKCRQMRLKLRISYLKLSNALYRHRIRRYSSGQ